MPPHASLRRRADLVAAQRADPRTARGVDAVRAGTTGSGDALLLLTWSAAALAAERAAGVRILSRCGVAPGMRVGNTLPGALATPGSLLLGDVVDELGGLDIPLGAIESDAAAKQAWALIDRVQPAVLVLDPHSAVRFFAGALPAARPWWQGIVWLHSAATPPSVPATCALEGWQRRWVAVPEVSSFVAAECSEGRFHVDPAVAVDVVDARTGNSVPAGSRGTLVLAPQRSDRPTTPYLTDLVVRLVTAPCPCATSGVALDFA